MSKYLFTFPYIDVLHQDGITSGSSHDRRVVVRFLWMERVKRVIGSPDNLAGGHLSAYNAFGFLTGPG